VDYSELISSWAEMVGKKMFAQVEQEEWNQWRSVSEQISVGLRDVVGNTPVGMVARYRGPPGSVHEVAAA
jgi:hypothetical protein